MAKKLTQQQAGDTLKKLSMNFDVIAQNSLDGSKWTIVKYNLDTDLARIRDDYGKVLKKAREFAKANSPEEEHYNTVRYLLVYALEHAQTSYYGETLFEQVATATFGGYPMFVSERENIKEKKQN